MKNSFLSVVFFKKKTCLVGFGRGEPIQKTKTCPTLAPVPDIDPEGVYKKLFPS